MDEDGFHRRDMGARRRIGDELVKSLKKSNRRGLEVEDSHHLSLLHLNSGYILKVKRGWLFEFLFFGEVFEEINGL